MDPEVKRLITLLKLAMRILGVSNREVERKLGLSPSYLSRLFSGGIELKAEHLIKIPQAIGMEPTEFFQLAFPARHAAPSEATAKLLEVLQELQTLAPPRPPEPAFSGDVRDSLREIIRDVLREEGGSGGRVKK